jgi:hypothetical protein
VSELKAMDNGMRAGGMVTMIAMHTDRGKLDTELCESVQDDDERRINDITEE